MESGTNEYVIDVQDLKKTFHIGFFRKKVPVLKGVTFQVRRGEVFGLVGPNGAGKTTVIKTLMGLLRVTHGRASILGHDVSEVQARSVGADHALLSYRAAYQRKGVATPEVMYVSSLWHRMPEGGWCNVFSQDTPATD